jgi:exopolyphosphatase/guanosine-5'-triphosphate,3'-diphosphate pyrophosphatase
MMPEAQWPRGPGRPIAAMDIGSNSIHLTLARVHGDGRVEIMSQIKDPARLAATLDDRGQMSEEGLDRAVGTLSRFKRIADQNNAEIRTAATAAIRAARNADVFLQRARDEAGMHVDVIDGAEEARLVYVGVQSGLPRFSASRLLCVDVGGGSTELLLGQAGQVRAVSSVPVGSVVVTRGHLEDGATPKRALASARRALEQRLGHCAGPIRQLGFDVAVGTGGSIQRLARMALALSGTDPRGDLNGQRLSVADLTRVVRALASASSPAERLRLPGIDPDRSESLLGGALVFEALSSALALESWTISTAALRLGLIVDTWRRRAVH